MKTLNIGKKTLISFLMLCGTVASAETIMYNGYPRTEDATYFKGFATTVSNGSMRPSGVGNMMKNSVKYSTLAFPACFDDAPYILPLRGGEDDASLYVADATGGAFSGMASGAKLLKMTDNCQSRTGSLHFRVLMRAEQGVLDALTSDSVANPTLSNSQTCGLFWTMPDYFQGCAENDNLRLNSGLNLSAENNIANKSISLNFVRGLAFAFYRDASGVSLRLFVWGSETTALASAQTITLVDNVAAGETYVCYAKIDVGAADHADVIRGMAQPHRRMTGQPHGRARRSRARSGAI